MTDYYRGIISATSESEAKEILKRLVNDKLIAGGLISHGISNHWWEGRIDEETYYNVSVFTLPKHRDKIIEIAEILSKDDTPGVVFFKIEYGNSKFLKWIEDNTV